MKLEDILGGSRVFVDANIIIYALQRRSVESRSFLARCDRGAIEGWISTSVVAEVGHRRMIQEAQAKGVLRSNPARILSQKPELVRQLSAYANDVRNLIGGGLEVETVRPEDFLVALELQNQHGLLTNDSLNLAVAKRVGVHEIVTANTAFDSVQGVIVYKPGDLV
jgi:predicted nucleic acid-binding protein